MYDFNYFKFVEVGFRLGIWSILVYVAWVLEKNVYSAVVRQSASFFKLNTLFI